MVGCHSEDSLQKERADQAERMPRVRTRCVSRLTLERNRISQIVKVTIYKTRSHAQDNVLIRELKCGLSGMSQGAEPVGQVVIVYKCICA